MLRTQIRQHIHLRCTYWQSEHAKHVAAFLSPLTLDPDASFSWQIGTATKKGISQLLGRFDKSEKKKAENAVEQYQRIMCGMACIKIVFGKIQDLYICQGKDRERTDMSGIAAKGY